MKTLQQILIGLTCLLICTFAADAGVLEVRSKSVIRIAKAGDADKFQVHIEFPVPSLPDSAKITNIILALDQQFDAQSNMPVGLANVTSDPIVLSTLLLDGGNNEANPWLDLTTSDPRLTATDFLLPADVVQKARKSGKWNQKAAQFSVTPFGREALQNGKRSLTLVVTAASTNKTPLSSTQVNMEISKLTAKLVISYFEPPMVAPWQKKK